MTTHHALDPELHALRSIARSLDGRERAELETARMALWRALDTGEARRWARAVRVVLLTLEPGEIREHGLAALDAIERAL